MDLGLKNRRAVVLAGTAGLGLGVARALAAEGCAVAVCGRDGARLAGAAEQVRAAGAVRVFAAAADVADAASLQRFLEGAAADLGGLDILVANAGGPPPGPIAGLPDEAFVRAHELSFLSVVRACRFAVPRMAAQGWGRIIALTSTTVKVAMENMGLSNIYRSAVAGYIKTLAIETGRQGIRANTVLTGPFLTDRTQQLAEAGAAREGITVEAWVKRAAQNTLAGRLGDPLEMGQLVAFLASARADFVTGSCLAIDGGALRTIS